MAKLIDKRNSSQYLKAFSLVETLVALLLISIAIACSFGLFSSLLSGSRLQKQHRAAQEAAQLFQDIEQASSWKMGKQKIKSDAWQIQQEIRNFQGQKDLQLVQLKFFSVNKKQKSTSNSSRRSEKEKLLYEEIRLIPLAKK